MKLSPMPTQDECAHLLRRGDFDSALQCAKERVRRQPADADLRIGLFQLFAVSGQWSRAEEQLRLAAELDPGCDALASAYARALRAEVEREQVMAGEREPALPGGSSEWQRELLAALRHECEGAAGLAAACRDRAFEAADAAAGRIDGAAFAWLGDADPRFGPCLEVMLESGYAWVAFSQLDALSFDPPATLSDLLWRPVSLTWRDGKVDAALVPSRYPGSERDERNAVRLGRRTEWRGEGMHSRGAGQRMLASSEGEHPLLEVVGIVMDAQGRDEASAWPN